MTTTLTLPQHPFGTEITTADIIALMQVATGWEDRYRNVIQLGKKLPQLDDSYKQDQLKISGCESQVWLHHQIIDDHYYFIADSDARIVRGLITLVLAAYDGKTATEINAFDIDTYFQSLGLIDHLSPSRGNGLKAIVKQIKQLAH
ncbi:cysteine desulfurase sulfur acceptor subunit CsdE [Photobacterium phosphoreum]|uniref:cysteine desulfurase sulfur acceptor subunit CsdE n=1 Tax=Photobacterium phosphoreum TaxID=659 RepID=UPI000D1657B5|nr:cysteine desulfurase sulfur acceptor subunit CsdE [Photobacterium phosphoreum]PSU69902.1 cysteine desulfurase sulfur acceptor subunit CsdE [Photobacterium phosphoreum]PSW08799.1 cysteine desulfurase sulfur acceptor subunit CsdE [Photobacterium phosphoreum]